MNIKVDILAKVEIQNGERFSIENFIDGNMSSLSYKNGTIFEISKSFNLNWEMWAW